MRTHLAVAWLVVVVLAVCVTPLAVFSVGIEPQTQRIGRQSGGRLTKGASPATLNHAWSFRSDETRPSPPRRPMGMTPGSSPAHRNVWRGTGQ